MDDRQVNPQSYQRHQGEANPHDHMSLRGFYMVGWQEHQVLIAEGHYRCPDCRRADTMETNAGHTGQR